MSGPIDRAPQEPDGFDSPDIAIVGMSGRFPGATGVDQLWRNLCGGVESLTTFSDEELRAAGVDESVLRDPTYVRTRPVLDGVAAFDAEFFGFTPREAEITDPQQRLFLECVWEAIESAGHVPSQFPGRIGLFGGTGISTYLLNHLLPRPEVRETAGLLPLLLGNDKDSLVTRVAYLLDLTGPCYTVQTYCSTSLVAVSVACENLLSGACDMAVAGGVAILLPQNTGYFYQEGGITSPDGRCLAFDARAEGSPLGNGVAVVALRRLRDALADGDHVYAVIKGFAVNNDGSLKVSYAAPSVAGQAAVVVEALANAGVHPETISYIEAHGTGTALGDPVEIAALTKAFRAKTQKKGFCAIGSVKTNFGHLDRAAGTTSLIKVALALKHGRIPPTLHFERPNPEIDFANSPFFVNTRLTEWIRDGGPRRAGVSAFGLGGTNAHVVLEEAPPVEPSVPSRPWQLLVLSARTETALEAATDNLAAFLEREPEASLADVAWTCQIGRKRFGHRRALVCRAREDAVCALRRRDRARLLSAVEESREQPVGFLFPGLGDQYPEMARGLYEAEPAFRDVVDRCAGLLRLELGVDLREVLFGGDLRPADGGMDLRRLLGRGEVRAAAGGPLARTSIAQPAMFMIELALVRLLQEWGLRPAALLGHSLGEYVAACVAGVFSLEDGLRLVAARARLIEESPAGAMLAVPLGEAEVAGWLTGGLSLAAINTPSMTVAAGPVEEVAALEEQLSAAGIATRRMQASHAFHSRLMEPLMERFAGLVQEVELRAPSLPWVSNVTGRWIEESEATDPRYWARHMRQTVRFAEGVEVLLSDPALVLVEVGPGQTLSSFVQQHPAAAAGRTVVPALRHEHTREEDGAFLLGALGRLWLAGVEVDWNGFARRERRLRVPLPTYPFERQPYWIDPPGAQPAVAATPARGKKAAVEDWFYVPAWSPAPLPAAVPETAAGWLIFLDEAGVGAELAARLEAAGCSVVRVAAGEHCEEEPDGSFRLRPGDREGYRMLVGRLLEREAVPRRIVHLWGGAPESSLDAELATGFYSLLWLAQALVAHDVTDPVDIAVVTRGVQAVLDSDVPRPGRAAVLGPVRVIPQEVSNATCRAIDLEADEGGPGWAERAGRDLAAELLARPQDLTVAWRCGERWVQGFAPARPAGGPVFDLRPGGVCLITGGLGGIGLVLAEHLARERKARLVLVGRSPFPAREEWPAWLESHAFGDPVSRKIRRLREIEEFGGEVLALSADTASAERMREVVEEAERRFGGLHGVIHAAGIVTPEHYFAVADIGPEQCEVHFRPKLRGLLVLEEVLRGRALDVRVLFSSLAAILGGISFSAYSASNAFLDAFAWARSRAGTPWLSVNWDTWKVSDVHEELRLGGTVLEFEMSPWEGAAAFAHVLSLGAGAQVVNSTGDVQGRIDQWLRLESVRQVPAAPARSTRRRVATELVPASNETERQIAEVWQRVLGVEEVGIHDNFFDLGGNSLIALQVLSELRRQLKVQIPAIALFQAPTVTTLAALLGPTTRAAAVPAPALLKRRAPATAAEARGRDIAIIGMAGRFPSARDLDELWDNLRDGRETITRFSDEELVAAGVDRELLAHPSYVKARPVLDDIDLFDAHFFGYNPREAETMDPQQRVFLETAWEALESAGYDSRRCGGPVGVFAGGNISTYFLGLFADSALSRTVDPFQWMIGNDKDSLATNTSYKLDLRGPSFSVQTFCSTSLVAVHLACQSLLSRDCDMALAGGVSIRVPHRVGYLYEEGGMDAPDGHCRSFDARARGTLFGDGVGLVVLKRLEDALADGDTIRAVIRGSAINNDGALKVGYTAPSVEGQAEAIAAALASAGVSADTISYVEAHGTATELGDPIEVAALTRAFRATTGRTGFCALGSIKSNMGHVDRAAGVSGLIKTVLALENRQIPASLHFEQPNPEIDFASSPFVVNTRLVDWPADGTPRRAGVNSVGLGGTNAHVVVEEAPAAAPAGPARPWQLLVLSTRSEVALDAATESLARHLRQHPDANLADAAYTLQVGRRPFEHRRVVLCHSTQDAVAALESRDPQRVFTHFSRAANRQVAFLLPGLGEHHPGMARGLYRTEPTFRREIDRCAELLRPRLGLDLRRLLWEDGADAPRGNGHGPDLRDLLGRGGGEPGEAAGPLARTRLAQPALFVVELALARMLAERGIRPQSLIGYSLGEYVAACLAGVFSLDDAVVLVADRARLIDELPAGAMLAVPLAEEEVRLLLGSDLSLAAVNGPRLCVVAGPPEAVAALEHRLAADDIPSRPVPTTHAFHSRMMEPLFEELARRIEAVKRHPPDIPFLSNVTGRWITADQAMDPSYWAEHLCRPVRLASGLEALLGEPNRVLVEVGPGQTLSALAKQHPAWNGAAGHAALSVLPGAHDHRADDAFLLAAVGRLWLTGLDIDWRGLSTGERRRRIPLPTYPFQRQRYWLQAKRHPFAQAPAAVAADAAGTFESLRKRTDVGDWFYVPVWTRRPALAAADEALASREWLLFADELGLGEALAARLRRAGARVTTVRRGERFAPEGDGGYTFAPGRRDDYDLLLRELRRTGRRPAEIVHLWSVTPDGPETGLGGLAEALDRSFYSLLFLAQALGDEGSDPRRLTVIANHLEEVTGGEALRSEKAVLKGPCKVIPQESPHLTCRSIDVELPAGGATEGLLAAICGELLAGAQEPTVALRGPHRWVQSFEPVRLGPGPSGCTGPAQAGGLRENGVYLITGGLGGLGLGMARHLAETASARLVLLGRTGLPPRERWPEIAAAPGGERVRQVLEIEALGSEVLVLCADVADVAAMRRVVTAAVERFGRIDGVVHAAGVPAAGLIALKTPEAVEEVLAPKVRGTLALVEALAGQNLDFLVLFSSMTSITGGGPGQIDYCAANAFLDSFANARPGRFRRVVSIDWGEWQWNAWQEGLMGFTPAVQRFFRETRRKFGIEMGEGMDALRRVLASALPQVIVSTADFQILAELSRSYSVQTILELAGQAAPSASAYPRPALGTAYVAPRTDVERTIAAVWQEMLGLAEVGIDDDFFELGGHSLLATQVFSRLRQSFRVELPLRTIFDAPTVAGLAAVISGARQGAEAARRVPPIEPLPRDGHIPLSFAQERLWFLEQLGGGSSMYNDPGGLQLLGRLDLAALERTLNELVRRHESLRTRFPLIDGQPVQQIDPPRPVSLPLLDLRELPEGARQAELRRVLLGESRRPFDLARGPLLRPRLLRLGAQEHVLLFAVHHIVNDHWSSTILHREVTALYRAYAQGVAPDLPEVRVQYADFARWQRAWLQGEVLAEQLAVWKEQLAGAPLVLDFPTDLARPREQSFRGALESRQLPEDLVEGLNSLSQREGVTLYMTLLAAFSVLLHGSTGREDLLVGTSIANRNRPEIEGIIGFFVNMLVIRARLEGDPDFRELLQRTRQVVVHAFDHQDLPFERLADALEVGRDPSRNPVFQVAFTFENATREDIELPGLAVGPLEIETDASLFDFALVVERSGRGLRASFRYMTDLFCAATMAGLLEKLEILLRTAVERPEARVAELLARAGEVDRRREALERSQLEQVSLQKLKLGRRRKVTVEGEAREEQA